MKNPNDKRTMFSRQAGFSLVELLVVITIIGVLVALLLPAVQAAREAARRLNCINNVKQIALAIQNYHQVARSFPIGNINDQGGSCPGAAEPTVSYATQFGNWMISILPHIEQAGLFDSYKQSSSNVGSANKSVRETSVAAYICPSDLDTQVLSIPAAGTAATVNAKFAPGSYRAVTGRSDDGCEYLDSEMMSSYEVKSRGPIHAMFTVGAWKNLFPNVETIDSVKDGMSNTLLVGEATTSTNTRYRTFWAYSYAYYAISGVTDQSRTLLGDFDRCVGIGGDGSAIPCKRGWGSFHPGGLNFAMCDGSVHFIGTNVDTTLLGNLATIDGGEAAAVPE